MKWRVERLGVVESTNTLAAERVRGELAKGKIVPAGLVIIADGQRSGRGQYGRKWESPAGGLYLSAVVGDVAVEVRDRMALFVGVAVAEAVEEVVEKRVLVRWPNDVMIGRKKVAGVLCESVVMGEAWAGIVGIGVNVNTEVAELPAEVRERAGSLQQAAGKVIDMGRVENAVLASLAEGAEKLKLAAGLGEFVRRARERDELRGKPLRLQTAEGIVNGVGAGIGDDGELLVETDGNVRGFLRGSVLEAEEV